LTDSDAPQDADAARTKKRAACPIVGLGASAGGLEAFQAFLSAVPADSGMAFVLIQHLDPTHDSMLAELLGRHTSMPVRQVTGDTLVAADHVYLIPPNKVLVIEGGVLKLLTPAEPRGQRMPIDVFFRALAQDQGENAACIILSGTGSDGTLGLRAIKEFGGLTMAQAEGVAKYDGMPHSAAATGLADHVLPCEEMPAALANYFSPADRSGAKSDEPRLPEAGDHLIKICAILRMRTGHDFSSYKKSTLVRRIQRRMLVLQLSQVTDYIEALRGSEHEAGLLFRDLLINVTQFFRDTEAFEALARDVIPGIVDGRGPDDQIRVWVPGCSTGEEAYTLAILIAERMRETGSRARVQIFASDIDEEALDLARAGRYPATIATDVTSQRLERFFAAGDNGYQVNKDIREMCLFSLHSVIKDPPFSRLDLISCRNLLIYLGAPLQAKLIPIFHYALKPGGTLFLGPSESITQNGRLFASTNPANRIFTRRNVPTAPDLHFPLSRPHGGLDDTVPSAPQEAGPPLKTETQERFAEQLVLDHYAPAHAVVTDGGDIIRVSNRTGTYLELPSGAPNLNIVQMARLGLRNDLRAALHQAVRESRRVVHPNLEFGVNGASQVIDLIVHPIPRSGQYLVVFQDLGALRADTTAEGAHRVATPDGDDARMRDLESELQLTRERLRTAVEELETSNEELKSSNEETMSMNEELQTANEELETSKEELQSMNEELQTVNAELRHKLSELSGANSDLQNLFDSTQIATIFLDNILRIRSFTPATKQIFRLIDGDKGRPLTDLAPRFPLDGLDAEAADVIRTLRPVEREVSCGPSGPQLLMCIVPYRTVANVIEGVVLTFVDVTRLKQAERRVAESEARYRAVMQGAHDAALVFQIDAGERRIGRVQEANAAARALLGYSDEEFAQLRLTDLVVSGASPEGFDWVAELLDKGTVITERTYRARDGAQVPVEESASVVSLGDQRLAVVLARDIRERQENQRHQTLLMRELQHRVKNTMALITAIVDQMGRRTADFTTFKARLEGRLQALSSAHSKLTQANWGSVSLRAVAEDELQPYMTVGGERVTIEGEDVALAPKAALSLTMALHELGTNAAKYGALSTPEGNVALSWVRKGAGVAAVLEINWVEQGGPKISVAPGQGFGRFLLEKGIAHDLDGKVDLTFEPTGARCRISLPWSQVDDDAECTPWDQE
jgi:two-component system CheB/CheR fusion protein